MGGDRRVKVHSEAESGGRGSCYYTEGLRALGRAEFELREVPEGFRRQATSLLEGLADFVANGTDLKVGQAIQVADHPLSLTEGEQRDGPRVRVVDYFERGAAAPTGIPMMVARQCFLEGCQHLDKSEFDDAVESFSTSIETDVGNPVPYMARAQVRMVRAASGPPGGTEFSSALEDIDHAISLAGPEPDRLFLAVRALALTALGRAEEAVAVCNEIIEHDPMCVEAYEARAGAFNILGMEDDAAEDIARAQGLRGEKGAGDGGEEE